jgi:hypothetical protein
VKSGVQPIERSGDGSELLRLGFILRPQWELVQTLPLGADAENAGTMAAATAD